MFLFDNIKDFRDEIAQPRQDFPWRVISQKVGKIQVRNFKGIRKEFEQDNSTGFEIIEFLMKIDFCYFYICFCL